MADTTTALRLQQQQHLLLHTDANDDDDDDEIVKDDFPQFNSKNRGMNTNIDAHDDATARVLYPQQQPHLRPGHRPNKKSVQLSAPKLYDFSLITPSPSTAAGQSSLTVEDRSRNGNIPSQRTIPPQQQALSLTATDVTLSPLQRPLSVSTTTATTGTSASSTCSGSSSSPHPPRRAPPPPEPHGVDVPPLPPPGVASPSSTTQSSSSTSFLSASFLRRQKRRMVMNKNTATDGALMGMTSTVVSHDVDDATAPPPPPAEAPSLHTEAPLNRILVTASSSPNENTSTSTSIAANPTTLKDAEKNMQIKATDEAENDTKHTLRQAQDCIRDDSTTIRASSSSLSYAMLNTDTQLASQYFQNEEYDDALQAYERATIHYCQQLRPMLYERSSNIDLLQQLFPLCFSDDPLMTSEQRSIRVLEANREMLVSAINAAGCYRNMGAVARILHQSPDIINHYLHCAQYLYEMVHEYVEQDEQITGNEPAPETKNDKNEVICLPKLIAETIQSRAVNFVEFENDISLAIACHEQCIQQMLLHSKQPTRTTTKTLLVDGIVLTSLSKLKWMELTTYSLQYLGNLYRTVIPESIVTLQSFQESIHVVKDNIPWDGFEANYHSQNHGDAGLSIFDDTEFSMTSYRHVVGKVIEILRTLSEIYTEYCSRQNDSDDDHNLAMDCAIDTLHDAMDVELQYNSVCHVEPNAEALQAIDQMGLANEQLQQYDKALACYEKALLARSQYYGENHIDVAKSLINVARIMEVQGNVEGGLDLYRAAHAIYTYQITSTQPTIFANGDDASAILQLIPNLLENERYEEARAYLMKCLAIVEKEEQSGVALTETEKKKSTVDKSQIYYDLGRACIGLKDNVSATIYLVESTKIENGKVTEEEVLTLLQHIDSMQRRDERNGVTKITAMTSDDIQHQLLQKIYSLDESIRLSRSLDDQVNLTLSNLASVPSKESSKSIPTTSFRTSSSSTSYRKRTSKDANGKKQPRSNTFSTASSRDLDFEQDDPIERPESVLSGLTSLLQSESSQNSNTYTNAKEKFPESDLSGMTSLFKDDSRSRNFNSLPTLSTSTIPTMDFISDVEPNFRSELFDPCNNNNSKNRQRQVASDLRGFRDEEMTIQLIEHTHISTMSGSFSSPKRPAEGKAGSKRSPSHHVLCGSSAVLSDDVDLRIPVSFDSNDDRSKESSWNKMSTGRGLLSRSAPTTPRKMKDEKSTSSAQQQNKLMLSKLFAEKLRRRPRREGFQSLSEFPPAQRKVVAGNESELPTEEEVTEEGSAVTGTVPVFLVGGEMDDDDLSEITMRHLSDLNSASRNASQEWWWGVTAEGFGRWFPTTYVTQAVQAADAFLSAKAIHAQGPRCSDQKCLSINSASIGTPVDAQPSPTKFVNDSVDDNSQSDGSSQDQQDIASNVGITSTKASRVNFLDYNSDRGYLTHEGGQNSLRSQSFPLNLFASPAPSQRHDYDNGKDIVSEILSCRALLVTQQKQFGVYDTNVSNTLFKLAILYSRDRDIEAAIECANEALRIQLKMENIPDVAQSLHFLADLYLHQKEYKHALTHYDKALSYETKYFGYISDPVAKTLNCIGMVRLLQNDFRASMESHQQALCILQECHDDDDSDVQKNCSPHTFVVEVLCHIGTVYYRERHQDCNSVIASTATTASSCRSSERYMTHLDSTMFERIGRAYEDRGLYNMSIYFLKEKSRYLESAKVEQTMDVLNESAAIYNRLGLLSCNVGSYDSAIQYFERALSLQLQLGCTSVQVAISRVYIASVQYHLGQYSSALLSYHDALECYHNIDEIEDIDKDTLQEHIALTLYYMGVAQAALCDYNTAMITLKDAHTIQQELFGIDNLQTLRTRLEISNLNTLYIDDVPIAMKYFQSIIAAQHRLHNVDRHPSIADTLHSIGLAYLRQKDYNKALRTLEDCYYMRIEFFGSDHPVLATTLFDLAKVYLLVQRHSYQKVLQICDHVLHIRLLKLHEKHIDIARVYVMKGKCYVVIGKTDDAHRCFTDAYNVAKQCLNSDGDDDSNNVNENHILFAELYTEWSTLYLMKCQFDVARSYIEKARTIYQTNLQMDDDYDGIIEAQHILHRIEHDEMLCV